MNTYKKLLIAIFICCIQFVYGGHQTVVNSRSGKINNMPIQTGKTIVTTDQWYNYVYNNQSTYHSVLSYNDNKKARVVLRFDDSRKQITNKRFGVKIGYTIKIQDETLLSSTFSNSIFITYEPGEGIKYEDIMAQEYFNAITATVTITSVSSYTDVATGSATFPAATLNPLPPELSDVYLDLEISNDKYFNLDVTTPPVTTFPAGFSPTSSTLNQNQLTINWNYVAGAESYDFEWLFIDIPNKIVDATGAVVTNPSFAPSSINYDFRNATRVNVTENTFNIPMSYPSGLLLFRVRAVGYTLSSNGYGSDIATPATTNWSSYNVNAASNIPQTTYSILNFAYRYDFTGMKTDMNWSYTASYVEEGKRQEAATYSDGVSKERQHVTLNYTDSTAIISETKYDYQGRAAIQIIPTPTANTQGLSYYQNFATGFGKNNFDVAYGGTAPVNKQALPDPIANADMSGKFYSTQSSTGGVDDYMPIASGYPYTMTTFLNDGTDRITKTSGVGFDNRIGSGHETKYIYAGVNSQTEIDAMFGNEVGNVSHYHKTMVVDPNGQVSISYHDQEDRTIATCIAGPAPANLVKLDNSPTFPTVQDDILTGHDHLEQGGSSLDINSDIAVPTADTYTFNYSLNPLTACIGCQSYCSTCVYDVNIYLVDQDNNVLQPLTVIGSPAVTPSSVSCISLGTTSAISCNQINSITVSFTAFLSPGKYKIIKILTVDQNNLNALQTQYINNQNLSHSCVHIDPIQPADCGTDCDTRCEASYKFKNADGTYTYLDQNGNPTTQAQAQALINQCLVGCNATISPPSPSDPNSMSNCISQCEKSYSYTVSNIIANRQYGVDTTNSVDGGVGYTTIYIDGNGNIITYAQAQVLIAQCEQNCGSQTIPGSYTDPCGARKIILQQDMSPGGQYFDNTYKQYNVDASGNLIPNTNYITPNPLTSDINGWLYSMTSVNQAAMISDINVSGLNPDPSFLYNNFNDIRDNWFPGFENITIKYHPEYKLYMALCENNFCTNSETQTATTMATVNIYNQQMSQQISLTIAESLGYLNPLNYSSSSASSSFSASDFSVGNTTYMPSSYFASSTVAGDPILNCNGTFCCQGPSPYPYSYPAVTSSQTNNDRYLMPVDTLNTDTIPSDSSGFSNRSGCTQTAYNYFDYRLKNFFNIPSTSNYFSIWYVMDDPMNIHTAIGSNNNYTIGGTAYTIPDAVVQYFVGLASTGVYTSSTAKYNFFLANYKNLRDLLIYQIMVIPLSPGLPLQNMGNYYSVASVPPPGPQNHYLIRIQGNSTYASSVTNICSTGPLFNGTTLNNAAISTDIASCAPVCAQYVNSIISQYSSCLGSNTSTAQSLMNSLCTAACQEGFTATPPTAALPTSGCDPTSNSACHQTTYVTYNGQQLYTFNEILNALGCTGANVQSQQGPPYSTTNPAPSTNSVSCACSNFSNYIGNYVTTVNDGQSSPSIVLNAQNDPLAYPYSSHDLNDITTQINNIYNPPQNYSSYTIQSFMSFCDNPANTTNAGVILPLNFPQYFNCQSITPLPTSSGGYNYGNCGCENLTMFINAFGYNPLTDLLNNPDPTQQNTNLQIIASDINDAFQLSGTSVVNGDNVMSWLLECNTGTPSGADLALEHFPAGMQCPNTGDATNDAYAANCLQHSLTTQVQAAANNYFNALHTSSVAYINEYTQKCLDINALDPSHQAFTMTYVNYLFMYTLYYYDQADNLVKTIPPEGYNPVPASNVANVDKYRHHTYPSPVYPNHGLVTNYKYSTLNHVTQQTTPDGGTTQYWYDALGRLAVSQNQKQKTSASSSPLNAQNAPYSTFTNPSYSYTKYDVLGRITEVGECQNITTPQPLVAGSPFDVNGWFLGSTNYRQVTSTYYDNTVNLPYSTYNFTSWQQTNVRNRISYISYIETPTYYPIIPSDINSAAYYSYDIHGNVNSYMEENVIFNYYADAVYNFKRTDYEYDIISGKVKAVHFQDEFPDQMHHQYYYDDDNRLRLVLSSSDSVIWEKEAKYFYYKNGPLARTELGDKQVAGQDHTYTIQGWLKTINTDYLDAGNDVGKDAANYSTQYPHYSNLNKYFANDAMGFTLGYFKHDYIQRYYSSFNFVSNTEFFGSFLGAINNPISILPQDDTYNSKLTSTSLTDLFNGNISRMVTAMYDNSQNLMPTQGRLFFYDQLNRIKYANDFTFTSNLYTYDNATLNNKYYEGFLYDFNGNIKQLTRFGLNASLTPTMLYNMSYNYTPTCITNLNICNNRLLTINDQAYGLGPNLTTTYQYDDIGNLTANDQEEIDNIEWNAYGKVRYIKRTSSSTKSDIEYKYSPTGLRIQKIEHAKTGINYNTYYAHDAQGNVMATYTNTSQTSGAFVLSEQNLYGTNRLGVRTPNINLVTAPVYNAFYDTYQRTLGIKQYELSNHLGNVLNTILDKKLPVMGTTYHAEEYFESDANSTTAQHYQGQRADYVRSSSGLYGGTQAFSASLVDACPIAPGDNISASVFSKGGSGALLVISVIDATGAQIYWNSAGLPSSGSWNQTNLNVTFNPSPVGTPPYYANCYVWNPTTSGVYVDNMALDVTAQTATQFNHYTADVQNATDYYAFGSPMNGRNFIGANSYRYGMNGQEKDGEVFDGATTAEFWEYDGRIGRRWNIDPIDKAYESPYAAFENNPIYYNDPLGLTAGEPKDGQRENGRTYHKGTGWVFDEVVVKAKRTKKPFNAIFIHNHMFNGGPWDVKGMSSDNNNWLLNVSKNFSDFNNVLKERAKGGERANIIFIMAHGAGPNSIVYTSDGSSLTNEFDYINGEDVDSYLTNGTTGSNGKDAYLANLQQLAALANPGGAIIFGSCRSGLVEGSHKSLAKGIATLMAKSGNELNIAFHNDKTQFNGSHWQFTKNSLFFGKPLTEGKDFKNGWTVIRISNYKIVRDAKAFSIDLQLNKKGRAVDVIQSAKINK